MTLQEVIERLSQMKVFHAKNEKNLEALDIAIRSAEAFVAEEATLNYYELYRFRSTDTHYPKDVLQICTENDTTWLVIDRALSDPEIEEFNLEYVGEYMSYKRVQSAINRLSRVIGE